MASGGRAPGGWSHVASRGSRSPRRFGPGPGGGRLQLAHRSAAARSRAAGFDLSGGSPFGALALRNCVYRHGYPDFRLADFADGWIYWKPLAECEGVTPIRGRITRGNLERARLQTPDPRSRDLSVEEFNAAIARTAGRRHLFGRLR